MSEEVSTVAEVVAMAVCFELQKSQNARPENKQAYRPACGDNPASDASPMDFGTRYAASVTPAMTSPRNHVRS